jgi:hypothetical protein
MTDDRCVFCSSSLSSCPLINQDVPSLRLVVGGVQLGPLGMVASDWPIVPAPGDYDDREFGGMKIGRGNRSTWRNLATAPLCPPQIPLDQTRDRTRATAVGTQ